MAGRELNVVVEGLTSKTVKFTVPGTITVKQLKDKIYNEMKIPLHQIRLTLRGKDLADDGAKLGDISPSRVVQLKLLMRVHGGH